MDVHYSFCFRHNCICMWSNYWSRNQTYFCSPFNKEFKNRYNLCTISCGLHCCLERTFQSRDFWHRSCLYLSSSWKCLGHPYVPSDADRLSAGKQSSHVKHQELWFFDQQLPLVAELCDSGTIKNSVISTYIYLPEKNFIRWANVQWQHYWT